MNLLPFQNHPEHEPTDVDWLRSLTDVQRGRMIAAACRTAAAIHAGRLRSGLPPATPAPWPESTWEFLRKHAAAKRS